MNWFESLPNIVAAVLYALVGMALLVFGFFVFDWITPGKLWKHIIEKNNTALAITAAAMIVAMGIIIAAAIVG